MKNSADPNYFLWLAKMKYFNLVTNLEAVMKLNQKMFRKQSREIKMGYGFQMKKQINSKVEVNNQLFLLVNYYSN